ncbi:MAG: hypothetical protein WC614_09230 [bacterium]
MKKFTLLLGILIATNVIAAAPDTLWTKTFGGANNEFGYSVQSASGGSDTGFIIAGSTYSFGAGLVDVYLVRVNSSGDTLWTRTFGGLTMIMDIRFSRLLTAGLSLEGIDMRKTMKPI